MALVGYLWLGWAGFGLAWAAMIVGALGAVYNAYARGIDMRPLARVTYPRPEQTGIDHVGWPEPPRRAPDPGRVRSAMGQRDADMDQIKGGW